MSAWFAFVEGKTEKKLLPKVVPESAQILIEERIIDVKGKNNFPQKMEAFLTDVGSQPVRCLVLRDLDSHKKETHQGLVQSLTKTLQKICKKRKSPCRVLKFSRHAEHANVYLCHCSQPDLAVALHIATYRHFPHFCKSTIDDYVLKLALDERTIQSILKDEPKLSITSDKVIDKVRTEIPGLLHQNGVPEPVEAKVYVRFYAMVLRMYTSPSVVAEKVLSHAPQEEVTKTFAPLRDAWAFLQSCSSPSAP